MISNCRDSFNEYIDGEHAPLTTENLIFSEDRAGKKGINLYNKLWNIWLIKYIDVSLLSSRYFFELLHNIKQKEKVIGARWTQSQDFWISSFQRAVMKSIHVLSNMV